MEIEKLIKHMREESQDYRSGRTLGRAFADAEDVLDEAATALEQLQAENERLKAQVLRWVSVEERKPASSDNPILIYKAVNDRNNNIGTAWYSPYHGWIPTNGTEIYGITHWMPLPKPPKEGANGKH